jgi:hypothetical protein
VRGSIEIVRTFLIWIGPFLSFPYLYVSVGMFNCHAVWVDEVPGEMDSRQRVQLGSLRTVKQAKVLNV